MGEETGPGPSAPAGWYPHPTMKATRRYWDGEAWTGHVAPDEQTSAPPAAGSVTTPGRVDPTFAWAMALAPLLAFAGLYVLPGLEVLGVLSFGLAVLTVILAFLDAARLQRAGVEISAAWSLLLGGVYLIVRTVRAKSTPALPVVWFATSAVAVVASFTFAAVISYDESDVEGEIESWASDNGASGTTVDCPHDLAGRVDDTMTCFARVPGVRGQSVVTVTIADEGYTWELG